MITVIVQPILNKIDRADITVPYIIHKSNNRMSAPIIIGDWLVIPPFEFILVLQIVKKNEKEIREKKKKNICI